MNISRVNQQENSSLHSQRLYARPRFVFPRNLSFPLPTSARTCTTTSSTDRRQTDLRSYRALTEVRRHAAKRPTSEQTRRPQPHGRCRSLFICFAVFVPSSALRAPHSLLLPIIAVHVFFFSLFLRHFQFSCSIPPLLLVQHCFFLQVFLPLFCCCFLVFLGFLLDVPKFTTVRLPVFCFQCAVAVARAFAFRRLLWEEEVIKWKSLDRI